VSTTLKKDKIKFALIGCGAIAAKHISAIRRLENAGIAAAYDINPSVLKAFGKKFDIPVFTDTAKMIEETNPDVLNILTPSGLHARNILELVKFNKHFVVEKPLALRTEDIDRLLEQCGKAGVKIFVVQQNRFNPPIQKLKEALDKGRFGKLVLGTVRVRWCRDQVYYDQKPWRGTWALDGGVLTNQASHHIDMLIWMMGPAKSVVSKVSTRLVNIEAEDTGAAIIKFESGALGIIEATTATRPKDIEGSISVLGEKGSVEIGGFFMNELKVWNFSQKSAADDEVWARYATMPSEFAWNHTEFFKDVVNSIQDGKRGLIDGLEGRKSVELINAIYESAESGKEVFLRSVTKSRFLGVSNDK